MDPGRRADGDEFAWLRHRDDPRVLAWLEAENRRTEAALEHTGALRERLFDEMVNRIRETDVSAPALDGGWLYYRRTEAGRQYPIWCRRPGPADGEPVPHANDLREPPPDEQVLLDANALAEGREFFHLGVLRPSPDHRLLAYSYDGVGNERFSIVVRDLETGEMFPDRIEGAADAFAWGNDGRTLFYVRLDAKRRPFEARRHVLGTEPEEDAVLYREEDEAFFAYLQKSRSRRWIQLQLLSKTTTEVRVLDADRPASGFRAFRPRAQGVEYDLAHRGDDFFVRTNLGAKNFRLFRAPIPPRALEPEAEERGAPLYAAGPEPPAAWEELVAGREDVKLEAVEAFARHLVLVERTKGLRRLRILAPDRGVAGAEDTEAPSGADDHTVSLPEPVYALAAGDNPTFDTPVFRFVFSSFVTPETVYDYDMDRHRLELVKREEIERHDPERYEAARIHATAEDGTRVPISIVHRRGLPRDGSAPCLLLGYGAYGMSLDPGFSHHVLSLLERGFVYAIAHVRGGGELGERWYDDGKLLRKRNTFTDFIACAEHLVEEGYTSPSRLAIRGRSAGGLLIGAVVNLRPDLFEAVLAGVPFVDVLNTMLDPDIPLTVTEYEEWGNPAEPEARSYIAGYSPYENVAEQPYPHILATAGLHDPRVQYWEPAKWVARLRQRKTDDNLLLLKTDMGAGHAGPSGRYDSIRDLAFEYAFLLDVLGVGG